MTKFECRCFILYIPTNFLIIIFFFQFSAKPSACELRVAQYEKPLTKGHCPIKSKNDPDKRDPEKLAKRRSERRERSHQLKEKIIKLIESGLQLSEYQARKVCT